MSKPFGLTIEGKHTSEFGLKMTGMHIPLPETNMTVVSVPGMSGALDLSEVLTGHPTYRQREDLSFIFKVNGDWEQFELIKSQLAAWIHGRKVKVVVDSDIGYYYVARLSIDAEKTNRINSTIVIGGTADPFKYEVCSSDEEWLWDSFDFEEGKIRELADITIDQTNNVVTILAGNYSVSPTFKVTESIDLAVVYNDYTYPLPVGNTKIPTIRVGEEDVSLTFTGQGKLSISYRGEVL